ncbi:MAG: bifunctional precorrin-2 dehydrogenase/sirohydrochlorin ferrochelatase [Huintestinicola sp.]
MGYFPFFIDIKDKRIVVVGGGKVAFRKIQKLMPFEPKITVVAPKICREIAETEKLNILCRPFEDEDIRGAFAVISATGDPVLDEHIYRLCREKNILVNTVDDIDKCGFIFPALVKKGSVVAGISTSGKSPVFARYLRELLEEELSDEMLRTAEILSDCRKRVKDYITTEEGRKAAMDELLALCLEEGIPTDNDIAVLLEKIRSRYEDQDRNT